MVCSPLTFTTNMNAKVLVFLLRLKQQVSCYTDFSVRISVCSVTKSHPSHTQYQSVRRTTCSTFLTFLNWLTTAESYLADKGRPISMFEMPAAANIGRHLEITSSLESLPTCVGYSTVDCVLMNS